MSETATKPKTAKPKKPEIKIILEPDDLVLARLARRMPVTVKALKRKERNETITEYFIVDPYNGNKLSDAYENEYDAMKARERIWAHEADVQKKHSDSLAKAVELLKASGYYVKKPEE